MKLTLLVAMTIATACAATPGASRPSRVEGFELGVAVPAHHYEITNFVCQLRTAEMMIDGELVEGRQWWGQGTIQNRLEARSPNWEVAFDAVLDDGTELSSSTGATVFPLDPGETTEFSFLVASDRTLSSTERSVVRCNTRVEDSVLNH